MNSRAAQLERESHPTAELVVQAFLVSTRRFILLSGLGLVLTAAQAGGAHRIISRLIFTGMCDASAGAAIGSNLLAVANDEDNVLRVYRCDQGGPPVEQLNVTPFLGVAGKSSETDLEGACWLGDKIYWIGSHSQNREGKFRPARHVFFATRVEFSAAGASLVPVGSCYHTLLLDLMEDPRLDDCHLGTASTLAPKSAGALNIEALCPTPDGHLLIGFRNPIPKGRALIVPLLNPEEVISGQRARLGDPVRLDLGGLGIRDMGLRNDLYYILAGPFDHEKTFRLYTWKGGNKKTKPLKDLEFPKHFTPEALVFYPGREDFQVLSDDGTLKIQGLDCKRAPVEQRSFHAMWITQAPARKSPP
jgi:hypothetical protein